MLDLLAQARNKDDGGLLAPHVIAAQASALLVAGAGPAARPRDGAG